MFCSARHDRIVAHGAGKGVTPPPKVSQMMLKPAHYGDMRIMNRETETTLKEKKRKREAEAVVAIARRKEARVEFVMK